MLEVGAMRGIGQRHRRSPRAQHHGREPRSRRRPGAPRVAAADPRRPVQDHGARHRARALGQPASRPPLRAHAHRRLRLPGHAQQPQRPADRRRAEHRDRQRQRGHRHLRAAVRPRAGIQGADRHVRRAVRQHRGRRHQHRHQVGHQPVQGHGLLLRRAVQAGRQRLLRQGEGTGHRRELVGSSRASPSAGPSPSPKLYNGRDKTFFMFGYEHITDIRPRFDAGGDSWVPTEKLRNGDFSDYASNIQIYDPLTRVPTGTGQYTGQPFPGNVIPANRISPIAKKILEYYSLPKNPGLNGNITDSSLPETAEYNSITGRVDQAITANNRMFGRYSWYNRDSLYNEYTGYPQTSGTWFQFQSWQAVLDDVHVFNPTTVLNVRYGYNRFDRNSGQQDEARNYDLASLGLPGAVQLADSRGQPLLPASRLRRHDDDRRRVRQRLPADHDALGQRDPEQVDGRARPEGRRRDAHLRRAQHRPPATTRPAATSSPTPTPARTARAAPTTQGLQNYASFLLGMPATTTVTRAAFYDEHSTHLRVLRAGRLARQRQADAELRPALRARDAAHRGQRQQRLGLRQQLHAAHRADRPGALRGAERPGPEGARAAVERQGRAAVRGEGHRRDLQDAEEHLPAALRFRVPPRPEDAGSRRRRPLRRLPRAAARRRDPVGLLADDDVRDDVQRERCADSVHLGHRAAVSSPILEPVGNSLGRQTFLGQGLTYFNPNPVGLEAGALADWRAARAAGRVDG